MPWTNATAAVLQKLRNPFWIQAQPEGLQSTGWLGAWKAVASTWAIAAESAQDLAAGVRFAREHQLRLVVKGAGHDYLGRNCAPDFLLLWTHPMRRVVVENAFIPQGATAGTAPVEAITVQAGVRWIEVYQAATAAGRYVCGGACGGLPSAVSAASPSATAPGQATCWKKHSRVNAHSRSCSRRQLRGAERNHTAEPSDPRAE